MELKEWIKRKKGIVTDYLPWVLIAVAVLVILILGVLVLKDKGISVIERLKELLRLR